MSNIVNGFDFDQLPVKIEFVGKVDDKEWPHFLWNVTVDYKTGFWTFPYKCGLAHVEKKRHAMRPKKPSVSNVMYSILLDVQAANQSFNDWCDEYGYDNDSMKAFKTYQTCCEYAVFVRKVFTSEQITAMRAALEDY